MSIFDDKDLAGAGADIGASTSTAMADGLPADFHGALNVLFERSGLTVTALCDGITPTVRMWLRGRSRPEASSLKKVAALEQRLGAAPNTLCSRLKTRVAEFHPETADGLPADFRNALVVLIQRSGMRLEEVAAKTTWSVKTWHACDRTPTAKSLEMVRTLEQVIGAPPGALTSRIRELPRRRRVKLYDSTAPERPDEILADGLPAGFPQALKVLSKRGGKSPKQMRELFGGTSVNWMYGQQDPTLRRRPIIESLERWFEVPAGTLTSRAFPAPAADPQTSDGLPMSFSQALKVLMQRAGVNIEVLRSKTSTVVYKWYHGHVTATTQGRATAEKVEKLLGAPTGSLISRLKAQPNHIADTELKASYEAQFGAPSYEELLREFGSDVQDKNKNPNYLRDHTSKLSLWCDARFGALTDSIGEEFSKAGFPSALRAFEETYSREHATKTVVDALSCLKRLQSFYLRREAGRDLPSSFREALHALIHRTGVSLRQVCKDNGYMVRGWVYGESSPSPQSHAVLLKLEGYLGAPAGALTSRIKGLPDPLLQIDPDDPIYAINRYHRVVGAMEYYLPFDAWPECFTEFWMLYVTHKRTQTHYEVTIESPEGPKKGTVDLEDYEVWHSKRTERFVRDQFASYLGFLTLPAAASWNEWKEMSWEQRARHGAGLSRNDLGLWVLFDSKLIHQFLQWRQSRSFDLAAWLVEESRMRAIAAGKEPMASVPVDEKTLPEQAVKLFTSCIGLVNRPHSFAYQHYDFFRKYFEIPTPDKPKPHFPPVAADAWAAQCKSWFDAMFWLYAKSDKMLPPRLNSKTPRDRKVSRQFKLARVLHSRDGDTPRDPLSYLHDLIDLYEDHLPLRHAPSKRAEAVQLIAIFHLMVYMPLRGINVIGLVIGRHLLFEGDSIRLRISKREFKSWIWNHTENVDELLPDEVTAALKRWLLEVRPSIPGSETTNVAFLNVRRKIAGRATPMSRQTLTRSIVRVAQRFLGLAIAPHDFRPIVVTTSINNGGTPRTVKAILNTSEANATSVYYEHKNTDERGKILSLYEEGRARARARKKDSGKREGI